MSNLPKQLRPLVLPVTLVEPRAGAPGIAETKFGGAPYAEAGETWPMCGGCKRGLSFVFQWKAERGLCTFYYCFECNPWGLADEPRAAWCLRRHATSDAAVSLPDRSPKKPRLKERAVALRPGLSLPDWEGIDSFAPKLDVDSEEYDPVVESLIGREPDFCTQIGGYPMFVQGGEFPACPACRKQMRLLVQIDSEEEVQLMWGDSGCVYLFECATHPEKVELLLQCF